MKEIILIEDDLGNVLNFKPIFSSRTLQYIVRNAEGRIVSNAEAIEFIEKYVSLLTRILETYKENEK